MVMKNYIWESGDSKGSFQVEIDTDKKSAFKSHLDGKPDGTYKITDEWFKPLTWELIIANGKIQSCEGTTFR